jgi:glutamate racemase
MKTKNKYAVIAGTPTDTLFGKQFLERITGQKVKSFAVSKSPDEQNDLQLNNPLKLYEICLKKCLEFEQAGVTTMVIYCNSLSSSINLSQLRSHTQLNIVTPLEVYMNLAGKIKKILLIAANSTGAVVPERIIRNSHPNVDIITIGYLYLVNRIEEFEDPVEIYKNSGLDYLLRFANRCDIDLIILACTHFPYITGELKKYTKINVMDLNQGLKELLVL